MHLKQLKLAGFKSFVDPTTIPFPSNLVAVVGPNGCGKSNIIDAVRWVMGESSAKNLRGESMTDVIFNGSTSRKSVGQASVELIFDNSLGRLSGAFGSYSEIAVKRVVTRAGDSTYFLNGGRCRRKDVTDLFLGTGAGARGYSIIGQGTISQLIEAKPQELRAFLEEAAGVSQYKERRRETHQRIASTHENLLRISDIREELNKQLQRLERQAQAAKTYLVLKDDEKLCRGRILALKWREIQSQLGVKKQEMLQLSLQLEEQHTLKIKQDTERTLLNSNIQNFEQQFQENQSNFYQVKNEIARLENAIEQRDRDKKRFEKDILQVNNDLQSCSTQLQVDEKNLEALQSTLQNQNSQRELADKKLREIENIGAEFISQEKKWNSNWETLYTQRNENKSQLEIYQIKLENIQSKHQKSLIQHEKITFELQTLSLETSENNLFEYKIKHMQAAQELELHQQSLDCLQSSVHEINHSLGIIQNDLQAQQDNAIKLKSEHATLSAMQSALQPKASSSSKWTNYPQLSTLIKVEKDWQKAFEFISNDFLHAYLVSDFENQLEPLLKNDVHGCVFVNSLSNSPIALAKFPRLLDKIQGQIPLSLHLETIYIADTMEIALTNLHTLRPEESFITKEGVWIAKNWVRVSSEFEDNIGFLARKEMIEVLQLQIDENEQCIELLTAKRKDLQVRNEELKNQLDSAQILKVNLLETFKTDEIQLAHCETKLKANTIKYTQLSDEEEAIRTEIEELLAEKLFLESEIEALRSLEKEYTSKVEQFNSQRVDWQVRHDSHREELESLRSNLQAQELKVEREKLKTQQLIKQIATEQARKKMLEERLNTILQNQETNFSEEDFEQALAQNLANYESADKELAEIKLLLETAKTRKMDLDSMDNILVQKIKSIEQHTVDNRLEEQALILKAESLLEALTELQFQIDYLQQQIPLDTTQSSEEKHLNSLLDKIRKLGAINLAAIEEFEIENQRKIYLDEQHKDLSEALNALELAISQMDHETKTRLENTFLEVNTAFKALFPKLFGGGMAQLELTCENLLEAGIVVMAQPPGKRNSTIHLLSGGEKAMTAVALVFAIFQLNPSPFCMLDEVDAPLDDVNVGRFCSMVQEMSKCVQFLFITHNKVTMELAEHLMGVTMREPGVSRIVAVDVTQALAMG